MTRFYGIIQHGGGRSCYSIQHHQGCNYQARLQKSTAQTPVPVIIELSSTMRSEDQLINKLIDAVKRAEEQSDEVN